VKKYERYKKLIQILSSAIIITMLLTLYMIFWYELISPSIGVWYWRKGNWVIGILYGALTLFFVSMYGGFKLGYLERWNVIYSQILSMIIVNFISYIQMALLAYHFPEVWVFVILTICESAIIIAWAFIYGSIYTRLFPPKKMLFIYGNENSLCLLDKLRRRKDQYFIEKVISIKEKDQIKMEVCDYDGVILCDIETSERNVILKDCFDNSLDAYITPKISDILVRSSEEIHTVDTPLIRARNRGLTVEQQFGKRCMDIVISILALIILWPIMLLTAVAVKLYDRGNIIYKQKRLTLRGKQFYLYKFRSMRMDAEKDGVARLAAQEDDRVTPVGKVIRMIRFDELPQLWNVLKGDMSLVGPRPERPEIASEYQKRLPQFSGRLKVKAGLTGYAQIYGKYNTTPYDKLKLDLTYIQNYSVLLDFKLLLLTIKILFMRESTEGVEDTEMIETPKEM
jgi:exopolysaccharide biosynthesis polyprenyl glycosylphosphotransferase